MNKLVVSSSPHISSPDSVRGIMFDVILALLPAGVAAVWLFGLHALLLIVTCVAACVLSEYISRKIMRRSNTIGDLSAVVTGLLLAYNLPPELPLWMAIIGSAVSIIVVKQLFGGIGQNFVNPALIGRIVLMNSFATASPCCCRRCGCGISGIATSRCGNSSSPTLYASSRCG